MRPALAPDSDKEEGRERMEKYCALKKQCDGVVCLSSSGTSSSSSSLVPAGGGKTQLPILWRRFGVVCLSVSLVK